MLNMLGLRRGGGDSPSASAGDLDAAPARPLRLAYCDEKGKFVMDPEAVAALQLVKGPVGVVSVCGRARQGKSFVLNQVRAGQGTHRRFREEIWSGDRSYAARVWLCIRKHDALMYLGSTRALEVEVADLATLIVV
jgi:hypothetical protein